MNEAAIQQHFEIVEYLLVDCGMDPSQSFTITIHGDTLHLKDILNRIPTLFGTEDILDQAQNLCKNKKALAALDNIRSIMSALEKDANNSLMALRVMVVSVFVESFTHAIWRISRR